MRLSLLVYSRPSSSKSDGDKPSRNAGRKVQAQTLKNPYFKTYKSYTSLGVFSVNLKYVFTAHNAISTGHYLLFQLRCRHVQASVPSGKQVRRLGQEWPQAGVEARVASNDRRCSHQRRSTRIAPPHLKSQICPFSKSVRKTGFSIPPNLCFSEGLCYIPFCARQGNAREVARCDWGSVSAGYPDIRRF